MPLVEATSREPVIFKVAPGTPTKELASSISRVISDGNWVRLRAIGAGSVNQAVKGIIIAQSYVAQRGATLLNRPGFCPVPDGNGDEITSITFDVFVSRP